MLSPKVVNRWLIHALCWPFLGSAKYILVNLALIKGKLLRELKFTPTPYGNLNKLCSVLHPLLEALGVYIVCLSRR